MNKKATLFENVADFIKLHTYYLIHKNITYILTYIGRYQDGPRLTNISINKHFQNENNSTFFHSFFIKNNSEFKWMKKEDRNELDISLSHRIIIIDLSPRQIQIKPINFINLNIEKVVNISTFFVHSIEYQWSRKIPINWLLAR